MTDFLADLARSPNDDALRQVYADALEEQGDPRGGEYLRLEVEWSRGEHLDGPHFSVLLASEMELLGLQNAKNPVVGATLGSPRSLGGLTRQEAECDLAWGRVQGVRGVLAANAPLAPLVRDWNARWSRLQELSERLDPHWLRAVNRRWAVVVLTLPDLQERADAITRRFEALRPSARGLLCGVAYQQYVKVPMTLAEGLLLPAAQSLARELEALGAQTEVRRSQCFFDFPAGL
jgi:uncharacterized protein (TIGR02996 family)